MNEWSDAEISRRLAIAIGWPFAERSIAHPLALVCCDGMTGFRQFDYRDPAVIWPICVKLNKWPWQEWRYGGYTGRWCVSMPDGPCTGVVAADTAAKAVALAVIKSKEQT